MHSPGAHTFDSLVLSLSKDELAQDRRGSAPYGTRGGVLFRGYSGEIDVRPQSSQRRYRTGRASDRPMTRALGTPHRGQTMPEVGRFAILEFSLVFLDYGRTQKGAKTAQVSGPVRSGCDPDQTLTHGISRA